MEAEVFEVSASVGPVLMSRDIANAVGSVVAQVRLGDRGFLVVCEICKEWFVDVQTRTFGADSRFLEYRFDSALYEWTTHRDSEFCVPPANYTSPGTSDSIDEHIGYL